MSYTKGYRYGIVPEGGGAYQVPNKEIKSLTFGATISVATTHEETKYELALTGAATINADISNTYATDILRFILSEDNNGGGRVVTFGTNFISAGTVTVAQAKNATITFIFSTAANSWVEIGRYVQS